MSLKWEEHSSVLLAQFRNNLSRKWRMKMISVRIDRVNPVFGFHNESYKPPKCVCVCRVHHHHYRHHHQVVAAAAVH